MTKKTEATITLTKSELEALIARTATETASKIVAEYMATIDNTATTKGVGEADNKPASKPENKVAKKSAKAAKVSNLVDIREVREVHKFNHVYLQVKREDMWPEVCHINPCTKLHRCVLTIHSKADKSDLPAIKAFVSKFKLTFGTRKLEMGGIRSMADVQKMTWEQALDAFGA